MLITTNRQAMPLWHFSASLVGGHVTEFCPMRCEQRGVSHFQSGSSPPSPFCPSSLSPL